MCVFAHDPEAMSPTGTLSSLISDTRAGNMSRAYYSTLAFLKRIWLNIVCCGVVSTPDIYEAETKAMQKKVRRVSSYQVVTPRRVHNMRI